MTIINKIIDGKMYARNLLKEIYPLSKEFLNNFNRKPSLTVIQVGDNPASKIYVKNKILTAKKIGIKSREILLASDVSEEELIHHISSLNKDEFFCSFEENLCFIIAIKFKSPFGFTG